MPPKPPSRDRARLAKVVADYWAGGNGPSHGVLDDAFAVAGLGPEGGSKRDRVSDAIKNVPERDLFTLLDQLIELLRDFELPNAEPAAIERLQQTMRPFGFRLSQAFDLTSASGPAMDHLPDLPALRDHIDRIQRAMRDEDHAQLLGSTKEMLESVAKHVLTSVGQEIPSKFPGLLTAAFEALDLHPKGVKNPDSEPGASTRKILGGALQIVLGIDELRNSHGTGHGRLGPAPRLGPRHARLAAGAGTTVATLLLDTLDDHSAPWRRRQEEAS